MKRPLQLVGIVILVIVVVLIALPFVVDVNSFRPKIESELSTALGRQVKVGNLRLSIWSGSVSAENLSIADDPAFSQAPFIRAKALNVGVEVLPLVFSKILHVTDLRLEQPEVFLLRSSSGKWNFSNIGAASTAKPASGRTASAGVTAPSGDSVPPDLSVRKLTVNDGRVLVGKALSSAKPRVYDKVNITVRGFSFASQFPFTLTASLPGGGDLNVEGKAGPINPKDASQTPLEVQVKVKRLDLAASGFVDPASGIAGLANFDGTLTSDGQQLRTTGNVKADKLKLSQKGSPAPRPVVVEYALDHNLQKQAGVLTKGDVDMGKAVAHLAGTYQMQDDSTLLNMKLTAQDMPVDELESMLPALGVVLPSGSSLKGGTLSTNLAITGPAAKPVIIGPLRLSDTRLAGFDLGSQLSAISALSGAKTGSDTAIQKLNTDVHVGPEVIQTNNIDLVIPALGQLTGGGTISSSGALAYKMEAKLTGSAVTQLAQLAGLGGKGGSIPFFIQGTTSHPVFVPDVQGMMGSRLNANSPGNTPGTSVIDALSGLLGKKKKTK